MSAADLKAVLHRYLREGREVVRVSLDPQPGFRWFGGWESRAFAYVPRDVRAAIQTNAGSVSVRLAMPAHWTAVVAVNRPDAAALAEAHQRELKIFQAQMH